MCEECRHYPCSRHCPNNTEKPLFVCDSCGCDIYAGEHFYQISVEGYPTFMICDECNDRSGKYAENKEEEE